MVEATYQIAPQVGGYAIQSPREDTMREDAAMYSLYNQPTGVIDASTLFMENNGYDSHGW